MKKMILLFFICSFVFCSPTAWAQLIQIDDNNSLAGYPFGDSILFFSDRDSLLYTSNGTSTATILTTKVKVYDETRSIEYNGKAYFAGYATPGKVEVWETNATDAGTKMSFEIGTSPTVGSDPYGFFVLNGAMYFTAKGDKGRELYRYTGSGSPTRLTDENPNGGDAFKPNFAKLVADNKAYFVMNNATTSAVYSLSGTSTIEKLVDLPAMASVQSFARFGNDVLFFVNSFMSGNSLYKTGGTASTTSLIHTFNGTIPAFAMNSAIYNGRFYFSAAEAPGDVELWSTDGNTVSLVKDINPAGGSNPFLFASVILKGNLVFSAEDTSGTELWVTDGTELGTKMLKNINIEPGEGSNAVLMPVFEIGADGIIKRDHSFGGWIFFIADDGTTGNQLWKTDGTESGTSMVRQLNTGGNDGADFSYMYTKTGLLFSGNNGGGFQPWISDGTSGGTMQVATLNASGDSDPEFNFIFNNHVYLQATDGNSTTQTDFFRLAGTYEALPIQLSAFTAVAGKDDVQLSWTTASESNSDRFEIMRSTDGTNFTSVASVKAAGSSAMARTYGYTDYTAYQAGAGLLYYRLKMVDKDGKTGMSGIISVRLLTPTSQFLIYPNPVKDQLRVHYNSPAGEGQLTIVDLNGRQVFQARLPQAENGRQNFNVSALPPGTYLVRFRSGNTVITEKMIRQATR